MCEYNVGEYTQYNTHIQYAVGGGRERVYTTCGEVRCVHTMWQEYADHVVHMVNICVYVFVYAYAS